MALKESIDIRVMIHLLYKFLKKANCVSILILDQSWGSSSLGEGIAEFLADGIIHLETYFDENNKFRRRLKIWKMRGTNHTKVPYEYDITKEGFKLLEAELPPTLKEKIGETVAKKKKTRKNTSATSSTKSMGKRKSRRSKARTKT